jgi:polysaccharide deacetylase family protein (PEP-CTERM system associated)
VGLESGAAPAIPAESPLPGVLDRRSPAPFTWDAVDAVEGAIKNVFSVDLEDWYQGLEIDMDQWARYEGRVEKGLEVLLDLLDHAGVRATFFVLGWQAERTPHLVPRLAARGHEIASHGWSHRFVYAQGPEAFRAELRRSKQVLEEQSGKRVLGYRAPFFSITKDALWALDILLEEGIVYDSSVFPTHNYRYGIPGAIRQPGWVRTPSGGRLFEVPLTTVRVPGPNSALGMNVPLGGGGYFRLYPYALTRALRRHLLRNESHGLVFYVHPWEFDTAQPRISVPRPLAGFTHYYRLDSTAEKTRQLLADFSFAPMREVFADEFTRAGV